MQRSGPGAAGAAGAERECNIQEKINFEIRMREGICKLLTVSTQKDQLLQAVKNLMVCNARIHAYRTELQNQVEEPVSCRAGGWLSDNGTKDRMACRAKVALSDIRIPLMWKGSDHFSNKEKSQRYAVFCLFRMGAEVFDTEVAIVDKAITDICFENVTIFGAKYSLLAYTTLGLESAEDSFRTHNLNITGNEESSFWLPLYGNMCCRLVAQPSCMARDMMAGFLNQQQMIGNLTSWRRLYCVLRGGKLFCYYSPEEIEAKVEPALTVSINKEKCDLVYDCSIPYSPSAMFREAFVLSKETRIRSVDKDSKRRTNNFSVINPVSGEAVTQLFATDSREELHKWMEAFWQHFYDLSFGMVPLATGECAHQSNPFMQIHTAYWKLVTAVTRCKRGQWKHCCEELMKIEIMSPRKPPLFLTKEATSVYHDMSIDSPVKLEGLADIVQRKIEESDGEFLLCQQKERASSLWASLFDGSHEVVVQKNVHTASPNDGRGKKRRAPPPPSDKPAYSAKVHGSTEESDKENWERPDGTSWGSSSDSVLSAETQQLQTPIAAPRKICPCRKNSLADRRNPISFISKTESETKPVPTPRQKRIPEALDPRSRLQPQT
ncbi:rhotekin-2 isoform X6 [Numida meleagris]|uniref:rhotekin-2 isoform X6 n=1 Tax=Numida meleagris TaxID=8996 RepID=UPI000B3DE8C4|nr:rhotekin-2 isoform X6 [Numida meleagris]